MKTTDGSFEYDIKLLLLFITLHSNTHSMVVDEAGLMSYFEGHCDCDYRYVHRSYKTGTTKGNIPFEEGTRHKGIVIYVPT